MVTRICREGEEMTLEQEGNIWCEHHWVFDGARVTERYAYAVAGRVVIEKRLKICFKCGRVETEIVAFPCVSPFEDIYRKFHGQKVTP